MFRLDQVVQAHWVVRQRNNQTVRYAVQFGPDPSDSSGASRTFLLRVAGVLGLIIAAVAFATCRGASSDVTDDASASSSVLVSSSLNIANLAPSSSAAPTASEVAAAAAPTLPDEALPEIGLATPQSAARNLWDSWRDRDRPRALLYATPKAVDRLFDWTWVPQIRQAGCTPIEAGWLCRFEGPKQRWDTTIDGDPQTGYRVVGLRIGDPAGDLLSVNSLPSVTNLTPITGPDGTPRKLGPSLPAGTGTSTIPVTNPDGTPQNLATSTSSPEFESDTQTGSQVPDSPEATDGSQTTNAKKRPSTTVRKRPKRSTTAASPEAPPEASPEVASPEPTEEPPAKRAKPPVDPPAQAPAEPAPDPAPADDGPVPVQGGTTPVPS
jgi:hypothetical protein